jgi:hypothetical protein
MDSLSHPDPQRFEALNRRVTVSLSTTGVASTVLHAKKSITTVTMTTVYTLVVTALLDHTQNY